MVSIANRTQHQMLCAIQHSLLGSGKPCGNARGRLVREGRFQPLVTLLSGCYVYLAYGTSSWNGTLHAHVVELTRVKSITSVL